MLTSLPCKSRIHVNGLDSAQADNRVYFVFSRLLDLKNKRG